MTYTVSSPTTIFFEDTMAKSGLKPLNRSQTGRAPGTLRSQYRDWLLFNWDTIHLAISSRICCVCRYIEQVHQANCSWIKHVCLFDPSRTWGIGWLVSDSTASSYEASGVKSPLPSWQN